ncbi:C5a anaphylatoxin chemotactic receptor 1-like [Seriola lalandi dorsalis]|uniref:C5a anaphylatoxin chemotactic receptor 1-like n=1 Tax=Seriola lalandi dorsalis TaxID=1841481 RepID=UPI000C6F8BA5|nr:C5a anaphylatoxin chemotactic receptor 1-like [Seriola lalandi dorsalis]XP_056224113.1 C5a anaphylatoxin chemotactic receptor 1-like [Seriola aureovittata]
MSVNESSNTSSNSPQSSGSIPDPWYIVAGVIVVICLLGIPANITVIIKLSRRLRGSSISQRLFFNLAVSDLLCLLCLPFGMLIFYSGSHMTYGVCRLVFYFFFFCVSSDLNILVLIGLQRYYQILHPNKWAKLDRTWQRLLLFSVWMLATLEAFPVVFSLTDIKKEWTSTHSCSNHTITPFFEVVYIIFIVVSHLVLLSCYVLLVRGVNRAKMAKKKEPRATKLFIRIIAVSLAVAFFPLILRMLYVVALFKDSEELLHVSKMLTFVECFYFFNHCLNPFLYFFASQYGNRDSSQKNNFLNDN